MHPDLDKDRLVVYRKRDDDDGWMHEILVKDDRALSDLYYKLAPKDAEERQDIQSYYPAMVTMQDTTASSAEDRKLEDPGALLNRMAALYGKKWEKIGNFWVINRDPRIKR